MENTMTENKCKTVTLKFYLRILLCHEQFSNEFRFVFSTMFREKLKMIYFVSQSLHFVWNIYISYMFSRIFELFNFVHPGATGSRSFLYIDTNDKPTPTTSSSPQNQHSQLR
jgi:hypothetical protein